MPSIHNNKNDAENTAEANTADANTHETEAGEKRETVSHFPCPNCGAGLKFKPETQKLYCSYCSTEIDILSKGSINEYDFFTATDSSEGNWGEERRVIHCKNCGANTVIDAVATAQNCAFCGSAQVVRNEDQIGIAPESLVPFYISSEAAEKNFRKWIKGTWFLPKSVKNDLRTDKLKGVYLPFWTYDADTLSSYIGEAGQYYYVTRTDWVTRNGKREMVTRQERKIRWYPTGGAYTQYFDDVMVNASKNIDEGILQKLHPFQMEKLVPYKSGYLAGFYAERYGLGLTEGWDRAREKVKDGIRKGIIRQINADEVRNLQINTRYNKISYKHILLPVWLSAINYKGKLYRYMVNGQTGKVQGKAPVSGAKVAGFVFALLAVAAIIILIVSGR